MLTKTKIDLVANLPDKAQDITFYDGGNAVILTRGPRNGLQFTPLNRESLRRIVVHVVEAETGWEICHACFRPCEDCSHEPCSTVSEEREEGEDG